MVSNGEAKYEWIPSKYGKIPEKAIPGGETSVGEILYIGRKIHEGVMTLGKVQPSHHNLYICFRGHEIPHHDDYEVLVSRGSIGVDSELLGETKGTYLFKTIPI